MTKETSELEMGLEPVRGTPGNTLFWVEPDKLTLVLDPSRTDLYDPRVERAPDEDLAKDLKTNGQANPLRVRKNGPRLEVMDGRRRTKAAIWANENLPGTPIKLKVEFFKGSDREAFSLMVRSNTHRSDDTPMERARKVNVALNSHGYSREETCHLFHCSPGTLDNALSLLDLSAPVQRMVDHGTLAETVARELTKLPREFQLAKAHEMIAAGTHKGSAGVQAARAAAKGQKIPKKQGKKVLGRPYLERFLTQVEAGRPSSEAAAIVRFVLGNKKALDSFPGLKRAADAAKENK